jgi:YgiT-type zinc finger domain-containing protein
MMKCPVCRTKMKFIAIDEILDIGGKESHNYRLYECPSCGTQEHGKALKNKQETKNA